MLVVLIARLVLPKEPTVSGSDVVNPNPPDSSVRITRFTLVTCYVAGILFPLVYLTSELYKRDRLLRFHSFQSIIFFVLWFLVRLASLLLTSALQIYRIVHIAFFFTLLFLMIATYLGKTIRLPLIGRLAEQQAG